MKDKRVFVWMMVFLLCVSCSACSGGRGEGPDVSGSSVSAPSASGDAANGKKTSGNNVEKLDIALEDENRHFFADSRCYFKEAYDKKDQALGFDQMIWSSGEKNEFRPEGFIALLGVTDEGVYYAKEERSETDTYKAALYRIPFEKGKGTELEPDKEELVLEEPNGFRQDQAAYIDENYIVYMPYMECVIKYDRRTGEKTEIQTGSDTMSILAAGEDVVLLSDLTKNDEFLYRLDLDSRVLKSVWHDKENLLGGVETAHSGYLFCERGDEVWAYDIKSNKREKLASKKQLLEAGGQAADMTEGQKLTEVYVENLFCYKNRLYIQLQIDWESGEDEKMGYAMFCMDLSDPDRKLTYDISISTCMRTRSAEQQHAITPTISWNSGRCHDITEDGRVILILNQKDVTEQRLGYFNIRSREFKLIDEEDKEYFIPYMDRKKAFGKEDFELKESYMCLMPDDMFNAFGQN